MKILEQRALERNAFVITASSKVTGSNVTMRVPGSPHKLAVFEFNTFASSNGNIKDYDEEGSGWMSSLMKP